MPNPISAQELIDIDGLRSRIGEVRRDTVDWIDESKRLFTELKTSASGVETELSKIRSTLSTNINSDSLTQYNQRIETLTLSLGNQKKAMDSLKLADEQLAGVQQTLTQRTEELIKRYAELNGTSAKVVAEKKRIAKELVGLQSNFESLGKVVNQGKQALNETANTYTALSKRVNEMRKELKSLDNAFDANTGKINRNNAAAVNLNRQIQQGANALQRMDASMGIWNRNVGNYQSALSGAVTGITRLVAGFLTLQAAISEAKSFVEATKKAESLSAALQAVHVSTEQAAKSEAFLIKQSDLLGINLQETSDAFITLAGATRGSVLEGEETRKIFNSIATAGRAMNRTSQDIVGSLTAVGQIFSKDKVQAEELSGQLAEHLPGALQILSKELGVTTKQLLQMASDGELLTLEVLPALARGLESTYSQSVIDNAGSLAANTNRLANAIERFRVAIFEESGAKSWFSSFLEKETEEIKDWIFLFRNFQKIRLSGIGGTGLRDQRLAVERPADLLSSFSALPTSEMASTITQQEQQEQTKEQRRYLRRLREMYQERLDSENKLSTELSKQKQAKRAELAEKERKEQGREDKKDQQAAEKRLREKLQLIQAQSDLELSQLKANFEAGGMTEAQYIKERYDKTVEGARRQAVALVNAGKEGSAEYLAVLKQVTEAVGTEEKARNDISKAAAKERAQIEGEAWRGIIDNLKDGLSELKNETANALNDQISDLQAAYENAAEIVGVNVAKRLITEKQGNDQIYALRSRLLEDILDLTLKLIDKEQEAANQRVTIALNNVTDEKQAIELVGKLHENNADAQKKRIKALSDYQKTISKETGQYDVEQAKLTTAQKIKLIDYVSDHLSKANQYITEIGNNQREADLQSLESQKDYELELAGDNAEAKENIEKKYNRQVAEIKRKQAVADRNSALFDIAINTAKAVTSVLSTGGGTAYADFGISAGVLSAIVIGMGALQAAAVLSQPLPEIPQYFVGTDDAPGGPAWVAERGYEIRQTKNPTTGKPVYEFLAEKQIKYLSRHDKIYTHEESKRMIEGNQQLAADVRVANPSVYQIRNQYSGISKSDMAEVLREALSSQPRQEFHLNERGYQEYLRKRNELKQYLNKRHQWPSGS